MGDWVDGQGQDGTAFGADSPSNPQHEIHGWSFHTLGTPCPKYERRTEIQLLAIESLTVIDIQTEQVMRGDLRPPRKLLMG